MKVLIASRGISSERQVLVLLVLTRTAGTGAGIVSGGRYLWQGGRKTSPALPKLHYQQPCLPAKRRVSRPEGFAAAVSIAPSIYLMANPE